MLSEKAEGISPAEGNALGDKLSKPLEKSLAELDQLVYLRPALASRARYSPPTSTSIARPCNQVE